MKKLLIGTAAVALGLSMASSAEAQGVKLDVGGHMKGYVSWTDTDDNVDQDGLGVTATDLSDDSVRGFDILRETEIHFSGETTLDNGLTVGVHVETDIDNNLVDPATTASFSDEFDTEEAYAYFSGAWGRMNFGMEDGAAYLLQVSAPSADSNIDGLRQYVQPVNLTTGSPTTNMSTGGANVLFSFNGDGNGLAASIGAGVTGFAAGDFFDLDASGAAATNSGDLVIATNADYSNTTGVANPLIGNSLSTLITDLTRYDYDHADTGFNNKLTYMTPVFQGFQAGVSYTPDVDEASNGVGGNGQDDVAGNVFGDAWEVAARWEGTLGEVGVNLGGGYSHVELEDKVGDVDGDGIEDGVVAYISRDQVVGFSAGDTGAVRLKDREGWNVGLDLDWGPFGLGGAYTEQEAGFGGAFEADTWTVGLDYTTGPFKLGASYYEQDRDFFNVSEIETERWSGGVVYTYGPGMTFRGSVNYTEVDMPAIGDATVAANAARNQDQDATSVLLGTQINF